MRARAWMLALPALLASACASAGEVDEGPAWSRQHDACVLACRASSCADNVETSCELDCRREDPAAMARLAERWTQRRCSGNTESIADGWWDQAYVDAALAAGLGELVKTPLPDDATEVRIWASAGTFARQPLFRLRRSAQGVVRGELYILYPADWARDGNEDGRDLRRFMRANCHSIAVGADRAVCHARFARPPRWDALYRRFESLGLLTLPDQDALPEDPRDLTISHGVGMDVEVRQGSAYRRYEYGSSDARKRELPEEAAAFEIVEAVLRLHWRFDER